MMPRHDPLSRRGVLAGLSAALVTSIARPAFGQDSILSPNSVLNWISPQWHSAIRARQQTPDLAAFVQRAFDQAPLGGTLVFPPGDYRIARTLTVRRQMDLVGEGARLIGFFGSNTAGDLLDIAVDHATAGSGDVRRMRIAGLTVYFATGGHDALLIRARDRAHDGAASDAMGNLGMVIERCGLAGPETGTGVAIRIDGWRTQAHVIRDCDIGNSLHLHCVDGVTAHDNIISGTKPGVVVDVYEGAFRTEISRNIIVCRDGSIVVANGSQVDILNNHMEQPPVMNRGPRSAHIVFEPTRYASQRCRVSGNNFGAGSNLTRSIYCRGGNVGVEDLIIENNVFNIAGLGSSGCDVELADASVRRLRLSGNLTRATAGTEPRALSIIDRATGTRRDR